MAARISWSFAGQVSGEDRPSDSLRQSLSHSTNPMKKFPPPLPPLHWALGWTLWRAQG